MAAVTPVGRCNELSAGSSALDDPEYGIPWILGVVGDPLPGKAEFLQAAALLAAASTGSCCPCRLQDGVWTALVSCPLDTWEEVFGEPQRVTEYLDASTHRSLQTWQHECSDGLVTCIGHLLERPQGRWVVLTRACFF
jgi:hypothetical protein